MAPYYPTVSLDVSLGADRFDTPSYTSLPAVAGARVSTGRQSEREQSTAGSLDAVLDNSDREYDPRNTAGTYYPNLAPGSRCRFTATYDETHGATSITYVGIGAAASGSNASLTPALPAGWQVGDLLLVFAAVRNSGTGTVDVPDRWTALVTSGNVCLLGRVLAADDPDIANPAPTITFTGGVANATTQAQCLAFRGTHPHIDSVLSASVSQLNSSAQNIAVPGLTITEANNAVLVLGWKQDDWTSVAQLSGQFFTEISDSPTTTGDDSGIEVQYKIETTAASVSATNLVVTGGASAISRSVVVAIRPYRGTTYTLFDGWTDGWPSSFAGRLGTTTLKAVGPFAHLARTPLPDAYTAAVEAASPVAWYRLNEGAGSDLVDSSGNGLHGRWVPELADVRTTSGLVAGSDSAVTLPSGQFAVGKIPAAAVPDLTGQSIEMWVRIDKPPDPLDVPLELSAEMWSSLLFGGGVHVRVWAKTSTYPGAVDFIVADDASLVTAAVAVATTAFSDEYWYYNLCDGRPHHVVCTINSAATVLRIYVDGVDRAPYNDFTGTLTAIGAYAPLDINAAPGWDGSCVLDEVAFYDTELSESQVQAHYEAGARPWTGDLTGERIGRALDLIGWPAALMDLDDGQSVLGTFTGAGQSALDYVDAVADTEQGLLVEAHHTGGGVLFRDRSYRLTGYRSATVQKTFSDQALDLAFSSAVAYSAIDLATDDKPAANQVTVKWLGGEVVAVNEASVDRYGPIPVTITTVGESRAEAESLAAWVLAEQSSLFDRIRSITIHPTGMSSTVADLAWVACLGLREGDRVRVKHQPGSTGAVISQELWIIGVDHDVADGASEWRTTFHFAPAITTGYWVLGSGQLGSTAVLAF